MEILIRKSDIYNNIRLEFCNKLNQMRNIVGINLDGLDFEGNKITELVLLKALQFRVSNTVAVALTQSGGGTLNLTVERAACFASANLLSRWMDHPVVITAPAPCTVWITAAGGPSS